ncbi:MAG TPA: hypothetical protein VIW45_09590 [Vicinamibacterales bacterium]|jgi:hypothetical protein
MTPFTVYLVVRATQDAERKPQAIERRLQALRALHDELTNIGVRVTPLPERADLAVEITNVFLAGEAHAPSGAPDNCSLVDRSRIMSIRLSVADEHLEFVCSDGAGRVPAERHAAQRILMWLDNSARPRVTDLVHAPTA